MGVLLYLHSTLSLCLKIFGIIIRCRQAPFQTGGTITRSRRQFSGAARSASDASAISTASNSATSVPNGSHRVNRSNTLSAAPQSNTTDAEPIKTSSSLHLDLNLLSANSTAEVDIGSVAAASTTHHSPPRVDRTTPSESIKLIRSAFCTYVHTYSLHTAPCLLSGEECRSQFGQIDRPVSSLGIFDLLCRLMAHLHTPFLGSVPVRSLFLLSVIIDCCSPQQTLGLRPSGAFAIPFCFGGLCSGINSHRNKKEIMGD